MWVRFRVLWGIRKGGPPLPPSDPTTVWQPNRQLRIYHTKEEAIAARKHKLSTIGDVVKPFVLTKEGLDDDEEESDDVGRVDERKRGHEA
jgi:hypothetical protein